MGLSSGGLIGSSDWKGLVGGSKSGEEGERYVIFRWRFDCAAWGCRSHSSFWNSKGEVNAVLVAPKRGWAMLKVLTRA